MTCGGGTGGNRSAAGTGAAAAAAASPALAGDGDAFPDRPYKAVYDCGPAPGTTHILEVSADDYDESGQFSGYAACGAAPDGWVWSPSGKVSCRACLQADGAGGAPRQGKKEGRA